MHIELQDSLRQGLFTRALFSISVSVCNSASLNMGVEMDDYYIGYFNETKLFLEKTGPLFCPDFSTFPPEIL